MIYLLPIIFIIHKCYGYDNNFIVNNNINNLPSVLGVSAMCGINGISVSIDFDRPFTGKIYSLEYSNIHECIYYNAKEMKNILFTIPLHRCGTRITRNTREVIDTVENRVYLQMEKYTQTKYDRQYSFLCELVHSKAIMGIDGKDTSNEIRRHPTTFHGRFPMYENNNNQQQRIEPFSIKNTNNYGNNNQIPIADNNFRNNIFLPNLNPSPINPVLSSPTVSQQNTINSIKPINHYKKEPPFNQNSINNNVKINGLIPVKSVDINNHIPTEQETSITSEKASFTTTSYQHTNRENIYTNSITENENNNKYSAKLPVESTAEPIRIYAAQELNKSEALNDIILEIQKGDGPRSSPINKSVKIGDKLTLVIKNTKVPKDPNQYNIFVHTCIATDGPGNTKIELIDKSGCPVGSQLLEEMKRERDENSIIYYFKISAFKFPGPDDVYFSCLVDISPNYNFPELCNKHVNKKQKRELITAKIDSYSLFKDIKVNLNKNDDNDEMVRNTDDEVTESLKMNQDHNNNMICISTLTIILLIVIFILLLSTTILSFTAFIIIFYRLKNKTNK